MLLRQAVALTSFSPQPSDISLGLKHPQVTREEATPNLWDHVRAQGPNRGSRSCHCLQLKELDPGEEAWLSHQGEETPGMASSCVPVTKCKGNQRQIPTISKPPLSHFLRGRGAPSAGGSSRARD